MSSASTFSLAFSRQHEVFSQDPAQCVLMYICSAKWCGVFADIMLLQARQCDEAIAGRTMWNRDLIVCEYVALLVMSSDRDELEED